METRPLGLYLHIPFCRSKCRYCDFCSFPALPTRDGEKIAAYVDRLCADLAARAGDCRDYTVDTVYLGGGTPTVLTAAQLTRIADAVAAGYRLAPDCEFTAECNPATGSEDLFRAMRQAGYNRLSVGLQSVHTDELRALGRLHDLNGFLRTWEQARNAGFSNMSADLMFGIPYQTPERFRQTLERVAAVGPEHLSVYALTVEPGTPIERMLPGLPMPDEDAVADMYLGAVEYLAGQGLEWYEISNFARPGYRSRHNLKYWNTDEYLGFGPGAHSDFGGFRFANSRDLDAYLRGEAILSERSRPGPAERENEYVMLRMRLADGLENAAFRARFGHGAERFFERLEPFVRGGYAKREWDRVFLTPRGALVSNAILSETVEFGGKNAEST